MNIGELQILAYIILIGYIIYGLKGKSIKIKVIVAISIAISLTVGARILYVINSNDYRLETIFYPKIGLMKIAGGLIGSLAAIFILCKIFKNEKKEIYNAIFEGLFLSGGIAKLNCHFVGCCYGKTTSFPIAISYPKLQIYNVHPVAFYEAIVLWIGFLFLILTKEKLKDSSRISIGILFYTIIRMTLLEGLYSSGVWLGTWNMRIVYIIIIITCIGIILQNYKKNIANKKKV